MAENPEGLPSTSVEEALQEILSQLPSPKTSRVFIDDAEGLILAEAVTADQDHPSDDTSAMDGYAVRIADLETASVESPVDLKLIEDVRAGFPPESNLEFGQTSRISTGGILPPGAEAVVVREVVEVLDEETIRFCGPIEFGANIRRAGEHLKRGEVVLRQGTELGAPEIGMAAFLGADRVLCYQRLKVAILSTGSELVAQGERLQRGQIRDSNSSTLACALREMGCEIVLKERIEDREDFTEEALDKAQQSADVVITSGGISAGWHDLVKDRIQALGGKLYFHKVRMRPGKPIAFGRLGEAFLFCLPGNPVSSFVTFEVFVRPAIAALMGRRWSPKIVEAKLLEPIHKKLGFSIFFRVKLEALPGGGFGARLSGPQGSHQLRSLIEADGLLLTTEDQEHLEAGSVQRVRLLRSQLA